MENRPRQYKRSHYLVATKFQLKYVGIILGLMFLTAILCSYVVYYTMMVLLGEKLANVYPQGRLIAIVNTVNWRIFLSIFLITPLVAMIGIVLSHRIAGPIYRMEKYLGDLAKGNLANRITLRKKDELATLATMINYVVESWREFVREERIQLNRAQSDIDALKGSLASKSPDTSVVTKNLAGLSSEIRGLHNSLDKFKLQ